MSTKTTILCVLLVWTLVVSSILSLEIARIEVQLDSTIRSMGVPETLRCRYMRDYTASGSTGTLLSRLDNTKCLVRLPDLEAEGLACKVTIYPNGRMQLAPGLSNHEAGRAIREALLIVGRCGQ